MKTLLNKVSKITEVEAAKVELALIDNARTLVSIGEKQSNELAKNQKLLEKLMKEVKQNSKDLLQTSEKIQEHGVKISRAEKELGEGDLGQLFQDRASVYAKEARKYD